MIRLTDEAYDSPVSQALVAAMAREIGERYAHAAAAMTPEEQTRDAVEYRAEVQPHQVRAPLGAFVVAWLDEEAVGCGALKPLDRQLGVGEIKRMYSVPAARRQGVSRAILQALEARAVGLGYRALQLETGTAQPEAMAFYESAGWHRIESYGRYRHAPETRCYGKVLDGGPPPPVVMIDLDRLEPT